MKIASRGSYETAPRDVTVSHLSHFHVKACPSRYEPRALRGATLDNLREIDYKTWLSRGNYGVNVAVTWSLCIEWDMAISWQLRGLRGCYGSTSPSFSRKSPYVTFLREGVTAVYRIDHLLEGVES